MRRDVYIENDSGGFSVIAAEAAQDIIEDGRNDDLRFVQGRQAMLLALYGDDSMLVRVVADEPLQPEEEAQWLARATGRIRTTDGQVLVMGGFDPDALSSWLDESGGEGDGRGVASVRLPPGEWQVDIYAHVGSMNGRAILSDCGIPPGRAFRRDHPGRAFPAWLAHMLELSAEEDPGHEAHWRDLCGSVAAGRLVIDLASADAIGLLVHFTRAASAEFDPPESDWIEHDAGQRIPKPFPLGLPSDLPDPELEQFREELAQGGGS